MSALLNVSRLDKQSRRKLIHACTVVLDKTAFDSETRISCCSVIDKGVLSVPISIACSSSLYSEVEQEHKYHQTEYEFVGQLKQEQIPLASGCLESLKRDRVQFLALPTASGKTCMSAYIAAQLRCKVLFLAHLSTLHKQTLDEYRRFTTAKVGMVGAKGWQELDVAVCGLRKACNMLEQDPSVFQHIGTVFVDEAHLCPRLLYSDLLLRIHTKYLLGMSATPDGNQERTRLLSLYFPSITKVHTSKGLRVVKVETGVKPSIQYKWIKGHKRVDWTEVQRSLSENERRNAMICKLVQDHQEEKFIILCDRVEQIQTLHKMLLDKRVSADTLYGRKRVFDPSCLALVAGIKKAGVGFNDTSRTACIMASDLTDVRQCEGRLRNFDALLFDLVDDFSSCEKHWCIREDWYRSRGAKDIDIVEGKM